MKRLVFCEVLAPYDCPTRYQVRSRTRKRTYVVDLQSYRGNGACVCEDFQMNLEPIIRRGIAPEKAVELELVELRPWQRATDALRCQHLVDARDQFASDMVAGYITLEKKHATAPQNPIGARR